jgi:Ca2+-binding RTX toxin-like protein
MAKQKREQTFDIVYLSQTFGGSSVSGTATILRGDGLGGFVTGKTVETSYLVNFAFGDLTGDGHLDIAGAGLNSDGILIGINSGSLTFQFDSVGLGLNDDTVPSSFETADLDGDGDLDLLTGDSFSGAVSVLFNDGKGRFTTPVSLPSDSDGIFDVAAFDDDKDGDKDIFFVGFEGFSRYANDGAGNFTLETTGSRPGSLPNDIVFVDIDGDGQKEIASAGGFAIEFIATSLETDGKFIDLENEDWAEALAAGDLDGDGDQDLASANRSSFSGEVSSVSLYTNDGAGNFTFKTIDLPEGSLPDDIRLADLDRDGDLDIVTANTGNETISILVNNGKGKFDVQTFEADMGEGLSGIYVGLVDTAITGTRKADTLNGTAAADLILGLGGKDKIFGGKGVDELSGGGGNDRFIFKTLADSAAGKRYDLITDFQHNRDTLDFSKLHPDTKNDKLVFIGESKFGGHDGELRFIHVDEKGKANDHTIVEIDFDGNRKADMQVELSGLVNLDKGDFLL